MKPSSRFRDAVALAALFALAAAPALPAEPPAVTSGNFIVRGFRFHDGSSLPELRLHYRTLGHPRRDARGIVRNAVLILHGTGGSGAQFLVDHFAGVLFGPGQPLDAATHYIVLPDDIGHGESSKPSDGLRMRFPRYDYADMVRLEHALLTKGLGVDHARLVMGTSMGGMHTWLWGEMYPEFMDALMPLASLPVAIAGRNRMMRRMMIQDVEADPAWKNGDYREEPERGLACATQVLLFMVSAPLEWQRLAPTPEAADRFLAAQMKSRLAHVDANDFLYAWDASRDYDPEPELARIEAPLTAVNSADDQINPPDLHILDRLIGRVPKGRYVLIPTSEATHGHSTHTWAAVWKEDLAALLARARPER